MKNKQRLESILETNLSRLLGWIQAADSRVGLILPLTTGMLGVIAAVVPKDMCAWTFVPIFSAGIASFLLVLSLVFIALASFPRTKGPEESMIFFGGIASVKLEKYDEKMKALSSEEYISDLIAQCHRNAQIAERKYHWVKRSITCIFVSLLPWTAAIFMLYSVGK